MALTRLVADIGGTNARFALWNGEDLIHTTSLSTGDYPTLDEAIAHYLSSLPVEPEVACLAIAGPADQDPVQLTNHPWVFSRKTLQARFQWQSLQLINDFEALAQAIPHLSLQDYLYIGSAISVHQLPCAVMGPGTGLGVALLIPHGSEFTSIATEGGHAGLAPGNDRELAIFRYWLERGAVISRELFLSGSGIYRLYDALCALDGVPVKADSGEAVHTLASDPEDSQASEALEIFCGLLGSACGDQALTSGARGGIYLGGGILPRLKDRLLASAFRQRFEDKGPMRDYVSSISTQLITARYPGLLGAAHYPLT